MNETNSNFDRLVDDELSEEERRQLLAGLDNQPDGWRRCALAFLESQCWKKAFGEMQAETPASPKPASSAATRRSPWPLRFGTLMAMAASFLLALWLGSAAHRAWTGRENAPPSGSDIAKTTDVPAIPHFEQNLQPEVSPNPWRVVRVSDDQSPHETIELPAIERDKLDDQWVQNVPPAVPDDVMQALQRMGHRVDQQRELVPIPLDDGRRMVVPVDKVNVHYVGNKTY